MGSQLSSDSFTSVDPGGKSQGHLKSASKLRNQELSPLISEDIEVNIKGFQTLRFSWNDCSLPRQRRHQLSSCTYILELGAILIKVWNRFGHVFLLIPHVRVTMYKAGSEVSTGLSQMKLVLRVQPAKLSYNVQASSTMTKETKEPKYRQK